MRLVEGILCEIGHVIVDLVRRFLIDSLRYAARNMLGFISVDEILTLLRHDRSLLLAHCAPDQVCASQCVAAKAPHNLHNLLLIDNAAIGRLQDRFKERGVVGDELRVLLAPDVLGDKVHRARPVQRYSCYQILDAAGL